MAESTELKCEPKIVIEEKDIETPKTGAQYDGKDFPKFTDDHKSLMKTYLTKDLYNKLKDKKTKSGVTLAHVIKTGVDTPHLGVGATAGDEESWEVFAELFNPIIKGWHKGYDVTAQKHKSNLNPDDLNFTEATLKSFNKAVVSTRIRAARSLRGHCLPSNTTKEDRLAVEKKLRDIFENKFTDDLKGTYYPLGKLTEEQTKELREGGFLFQKPRPTNLLYFSGAARDWPEGRGIFHNDKKTALCWVNEEDHCRIISMSKDGDLKSVFKRFCEISNTFEKNAKIMYNDTHGYVGTCPSNIGTGMRASVMVKLENFNMNVTLLEEACTALDLQPRGSKGEHSAAEGAKWDISNKQRIGFSEVELVQKLIDGLTQLLKWEERLSNNEELKDEIASYRSNKIAGQILRGMDMSQEDIQKIRNLVTTKVNALTNSERETKRAEAQKWEDEVMGCKTLEEQLKKIDEILKKKGEERGMKLEELEKSRSEDLTKKIIEFYGNKRADTQDRVRALFKAIAGFGIFKIKPATKEENKDKKEDNEEKKDKPDTNETEKTESKTEEVAEKKETREETIEREKNEEKN